MHRVLAAAIIVAMSIAIAHADEVIVESREGGKNFQNFKEIEGKWINSNNPATTSKSTAAGLSDQTIGSKKFMFAGPAAAANPPASARFFPQFTAPAHYYVYATWPRAANANPVTYNIKHAKGEEKKQVIQNGWGAGGGGNADRWVPLGDYDFLPGPDQYVEVRVDVGVQAPDARNPGQVYADAIRFSTEDSPSPSGPTFAAASTPAAPPPSLPPPSAPAPILTPAAPVPTVSSASTTDVPPALPTLPTLPVAGAPATSAGASTPAASTGILATPDATPAEGPTPTPWIPNAPTVAAGPVSTPAPAAVAIPWATDIASARATARQSGKRILLFFFAADSSLSSYFEDTLFKDGAVSQLIANNYVPVRLNFRDHTDTAYKLSVFRAGTVNIYDAQGNALGQVSEQLSPQEFATRLRL